jgi:dihydroxyacetone kinase
MKKLINKPEEVVKEELKGIALAHPDLVKVHFDPDFVVRADAPVQGKVGVISGGGSGHEPMHGIRRHGHAGRCLPWCSLHFTDSRPDAGGD